MLTGTLAMLVRALRLDARLLRAHLFRAGFALLVFASLVYTILVGGLVGAPGLKMFSTMTYLNVVLISLAGVSFFATAITEEKEEDTLGLLMLAGINPLGILFGKSTSRLVSTLLLLLVQIPFTLLAITLGGVTVNQVLAAYTSLAAYLLLVANMGVLASVICRRGGSASFITLVLIGLYLASPILVWVTQIGLQNSGLVQPKSNVDLQIQAFHDGLQQASILTQVSEIMRTGFAGHIFGFQVLTCTGTAAVLFFLAWIGFRRFTRHSGDQRGPRADLTARFIGLGRHRRSRPVRYPLAWKEFHFVAGGLQTQILKFVVYGILVLLTLWAADRYYSYTLADSGKFVALGMLGLLTFEACLYASRVFHDEWREHTLPLLAMVPGKPSRMIAGKLLGCLPALLPALFWLFAGCVIWPAGLSELGLCLILPSRWFYGLLLLLFMTLTAFFSMIVRWGSLPLAATVMAAGMFFSSCCGSPVIMMLSTAQQQGTSFEMGFLMVDAVVLTLILGLQYDVRRRIEIASAQ
ncbi:MAG: hypothetical protein JSS02_23180 [Planctomycetes bacterium]|nr:hypothetical protein [Planctomycetota bacterium]